MTWKYLMASAVLAIVAAGSADGAPIYTFSGHGDFTPSNAEQWGGSNYTNSSVILEATFDYTQAAIDQLALAGTDSLVIWEAGGGTLGSNVLLGDTNVYLRVRGGGNLDAVGPHGLSGVTTDVQVVSVIDLVNDEISVYVNGSLVQLTTGMTGNDWAGNNPARLGSQNVLGGGASPGSGAIANYPQANANMSFKMYLLNDGVNTGDVTDVEDVLVQSGSLVPEPTSLMLLVLGGLVGLIIVRQRIE